MARWVGMVVSGADVVTVDAEVPEVGPIVIQRDHNIKLQSGSREQAYAHLYQEVANHLRENEVARVVIMASAVSRAGGGVAHLESAEVRGVVAAAAASVCPTELLGKATVSKSYGERKADAYIADGDFWDENLDGVVRIGSRMAALLLLAARNAS